MRASIIIANRKPNNHTKLFVLLMGVDVFKHSDTSILIYESAFRPCLSLEDAIDNRTDMCGLASIVNTCNM